MFQHLLKGFFFVKTLSIKVYFHRWPELITLFVAPLLPVLSLKMLHYIYQ